MSSQQAFINGTNGNPGEKMPSHLNEHYLETENIIDNIKFKHDRTKKRKCAIFVMVQDENIFLPIWLKYYSKYFDGEDIFVFDHRSSDDSIEKCQKQFRFRVIRLEYPYSFDHKWFHFVATSMQAKLLEYYEYAIFNDIDEILLANIEKYKGLNDYINKLKKKSVRCKGYELIHLQEKENPFDPEKQVLCQRRFWYRNKLWDKTLLTSKPLNWRVGFHKISRSIIGKIFFTLFPNIDNDLLLVHLHKIDFDMCWEKTVARSKLPWPEEEIKAGRGFQNRITDFEEFKDYYYKFPPDKGKTTEIPKKLIKTELF